MNKILSPIKKRVLHYIDYVDIRRDAFYAKTGIVKSNFSGEGAKSEIGGDKIIKILNEYPNLSPEWLLTGKGEMLKADEGMVQKNPETRHLIPVYNSVISRGGGEVSANTDGVSQPDEYIDTGDWFREATAAIRHYGESMIEYPPGCILALKEVYDRALIIPGRDYMIETSEYRVTKRVKLGRENDSIIACSTNEEKYPDGSLVHEPFTITWNAIRRISLVLGYVVKKSGGTMVFSIPKK